MSKKTINDELQKRSPLLREMRQKDDGFCVPEGYFEALEDSVFNRIEAAGARRNPVWESHKGGMFARIFRAKWVWAAAAVFVLVLAATWFFKSNLTQTAPVAASQELTEEEIEAYVANNIHDFEAEQLAMLFPDEPRAAEPAPEAIPETPQPKTSDPLDSLSEEQLEILLKDMSDEELESLLKS